MVPRDLKVLFVCAEVAPFSSVGGLSQVAYFLCRALRKLGVDVRIFTPRYGIIDSTKYRFKTILPKLSVPTGEIEKPSHQPTHIDCSILVHVDGRSEVPVYFLENEEYYQKRANVYNYSDDPIRFGLLSRGAVEFIKAGYFVPDIVHANDWHTGYLFDYLRHDTAYKDDPHLKRIASLLSIHNIYQGLFDFTNASEMDFDDGKSQLVSFFSDRFIKQNSLKRGVMYSDLANTVSETYAKELLSEDYGGGLENLFRELRGKLYGVLNGLDITDFNPLTDKIIKTNFSKSTLELRSQNKADLQKTFGLDIDPTAPLLSYEGRLDLQKGLDLLTRNLEFMIEELGIQFVAVGPGDQQYQEYFRETEKKYPGRVGTHLQRDFLLPRKVFAGADAILMPSKYEPGGIVAIEALRYGCVPIVRATGGLADSVINYDPVKDTGYGFSFKNFSPEAFLTAVVRATETYKNQVAWKKIVRRAMEQDFSWEKSAEKYLDLYKRAIEFRREALSPNPSPAFRPLYS